MSAAPGWSGQIYQMKIRKALLKWNFTHKKYFFSVNMPHAVWGRSSKKKHCLFEIQIELSIFSLFRATPAAYGGSQARGQIGAAAASLCHSHGDARSETHL